MHPTRRLPVIRSYVGEWLDRLRGRAPRGGDGVEWFPEDGDLVLRVPLAGFRAREIAVAVAEDHVVIDARAERAQRLDGMGELHAQEDLHLLLPFPEAVDRDRAHARLRSGVLTIRAPRASGGGDGARRIPVKS